MKRTLVDIINNTFKDNSLQPNGNGKKRKWNVSSKVMESIVDQYHLYKMKTPLNLLKRLEKHCDSNGWPSNHIKESTKSFLKRYK